MSNVTQDIVAKLWNLSKVLMDDGVTYHQYVTELTYLLFLKMLEERQKENLLPEGYRWQDLVSKSGIDQLNYYRKMLTELSIESSNPLITAIYDGASSFIKKPTTLVVLVTSIDALDWYSAKEEGLGNLYEGLLEKNANEKKSGAGQYFTPRPLIEAMVNVLQPQAGEIIQDPAAGTCGFLIAADQYIKNHTNDLFDLTEEQQNFHHHGAFVGMEHVQDTYRLAIMNLMLHDIYDGLRYGDTLSSDGQRLPKADIVLTNPPFGTKKGNGIPSRDDFTYPTSNKQFAFLQHIYRALKPGGRAAVVLPDNVLFESNGGRKIRTDLMDKCKLHTILRLPTGIFYAQGVKTNVLFFQRGKTDKGNTKDVWVYDMRANMDNFGKRTPLTHEHFIAFEEAYGKDPNGKSKRTDEGEGGRFRKFSREYIEERGENLDISWLKDDSQDNEENGGNEPDAIATQAITKLEAAIDDLREVIALVGEGA